MGRCVRNAAFGGARPARRRAIWLLRCARWCHIASESPTTEAIMIDLYFWQTPNGRKVSIMLEELELPYQLLPINIGRGEQFKPEFLAISPNNRIPAIVDHEPAGGGAPISVFESG